ncbi:hypothetical protein MAPG_00568 [Magnaporthiopsis poae ATCC 64411]|uniref:Uncharacterized protein n=1 Tax=Magnaporthiopsis poae (strain ATCC 64411 / 73-15) TaxID=644358 RepID=A0A0C4DLC7_MAGP6|nr:hypothetical protein MAPG_00568 [Magnaporthiopsis poae ATCC 64411]
MAASLQFFLTRPGRTHTSTSTSRVYHGTHVPLIPVDQLPDWLHIVGVPRVLSDQHVAGLTHVGFVSRPQEAFEVFILERQLYELDQLLEQHEQMTPEASCSTTASHTSMAATAGKTADRAQQQKFGLKPGDFIKAQALGNAERARRGGGPVVTERSMSPEQLSAASNAPRAQYHDDGLVTEGTSRPATSADQAALEKNKPDVRQRSQRDVPGDGPSPEHSGPVAILPVPDSRRPVARGGLANSMHAPHAAPEQKARLPSNKLPAPSRGPGAQQQQQGPQPKGLVAPAEARSHSQGRGTAQELSRGPAYCRHWCMHGTCKVQFCTDPTVTKTTNSVSNPSERPCWDNNH